jgi:SAM-dependent methyltransferase
VHDPAILATTYWETVAQSRWGNYTTQIEKAVLLKAAGMLGKPGTFLEVGCEGGRWSVLLDRRGWRAICTDVDDRSLDVCQERLPDATCVLVDEEDTTLPCETSHVSLVLCIEVPSALRTEWFLREASRVLKNDGVLVGVFFNKHSLRGYVRHLAASAFRKFDWYERSYSDWKNAARANGFEFLCEEGICWFPFSRNSNSPLVRPAVWLERVLGLRRLISVSPWIVFIARKPSSTAQTRWRSV